MNDETQTDDSLEHEARSPHEPKNKDSYKKEPLKNKSRAKRAQAEPKTRDARLDAPALKTWNEEMRNWPAAGNAAPSAWVSQTLQAQVEREGRVADWRDVIIEFVGDRNDEWRETLRAWKGVSKNLYNIAGCLNMLDERTGKRAQNPIDKTREQDRGQATASDALRAAVRERQNRDAQA